MELPRDNTGLLILRDTGELVSSADLPEANTGDVLALDEPGLVIEPNPISIDLSSDLSLDEDLSLSAPPPPPPVIAAAPRAARVMPPPPPMPAPVAPAAFSLPPNIPAPHFDLGPAPRLDSGVRAVMGTPLMGTPVGPPARVASAPRPVGKTVADSGLKPMAPRIVGLSPAVEPPPVEIAQRRAQVGPRAIKERDRRSTSEVEVPLSPLEAPGSGGAAPASSRSSSPAPTSAARVHKAEVCYDQAVADFRAGNRVASENGLKLAVTYAPGELRYKQALERLRAGLEP
jgi:hypothetical protein